MKGGPDQRGDEKHPKRKKEELSYRISSPAVGRICHGDSVQGHVSMVGVVDHTVRVVITHIRNVASVVKLMNTNRLLAPGRVAGRSMFIIVKRWDMIILDATQDLIIRQRRPGLLHHCKIDDDSEKFYL